MRSLISAVVLACGLSGATPGLAQDVEALCSRASLTAATEGTITAETISFAVVDRFVCTYLPSNIDDGAEHPMLIALHGGSGNASQMMDDDHGIIAAAEAGGYVAVFPNGLPAVGCAALPCLDNNWERPENVFFVADLISRQKASARVADDRVHLVGFSGGALLIHRIVATSGFPHAIHSIATVAGLMGAFSSERPDDGFSVIQLQEGAPTSALLVQGGSDDHVPANGGLDQTGRESHVSFRTKVDYWRLVTGTAADAARPVDVQSLDPGAPADLAAVRYGRAGPIVVEVLDPGLGHAWPDWNVMAVAAELFGGP